MRNTSKNKVTCKKQDNMEFKVNKPDNDIYESITQKIDNLNKPKGSMGILEDIATRICLIQHTLSPTLNKPCHLLFAADHGIQFEGVSASPREVTWQQMVNFTNGGGGVNMLCRQHGFELKLIDVGVDHDLSDYPDILNKKIAMGTKNFLTQSAMDEEQYEKALAVGAEMVEECAMEGSDIICLGEMGIGNTSPSSVWMSLLCNFPLALCVGAGSGLSEDGVRHKYEVLSTAIYHFMTKENKMYRPYNMYQSLASAQPENVIRYFGGFEMIASIGAMLKAAELNIIILIDGFIMTACALAAKCLCPNVVDYMIFGHQGDELGHAHLLEYLDVKPILNLGLRLGEGTGALCAFPIVDTAVRMMNEMGNFQDNNITKYF